MDVSQLRDRLRSIVGGGAGRTPRQTGVPAPPDGDAGSDATSQGEGADITSALGGDWRAFPAGSCFVVERRADAASAHGCAPVGAFAAQIAHGIGAARILTDGAEVRGRLVFFDLETTGLSGGAGTYPFLIGCGWFDDRDGFVTRQYVLTRVVEEPAVLRAFAAQIEDAGTLVSFNGKTFDAPVLETRYSYHRLAFPAMEMTHLDMLHPARRFWANRGALAIDDEPHGVNFRGRPLASCSLGALERHVLGAARAGDVPGVEIPERYFQFLRSGDARPLAAVLEHNRIDLLSLAGITARLLSLVERGCEGVRHASEAFALGSVYARAGLDDRAGEAYRRAAALAVEQANGGVRIDALRALALAARRRRAYDDAAGWWRALLEIDECPGEVARQAHEALAVHHEHRLRDFDGARAFALRILEERPRPAWTDSVRHRIARIERKMRTPGGRPVLLDSLDP